MSTLPSLTKTWRFQVNQAIAGGGTVLIAAQNLMWAIKESLIGNGAWTNSAGAGAASAGNWTVVKASNSVAVATSDNWVASTNLIWSNAGVAHSWIVLQQAGIGTGSFQILIDLVDLTPTNVRVSVSPSGAFTGGTIQNPPTATDQTLVTISTWGAYNGGNPSTLHVLRSTDGACNRVLICRGGFTPGYWCFDALANPASDWAAEAFLAYCGGNTASVASYPVYANFNAAWYTYRNGYVAQASVGTEWSRQLGGYPGQSVANDMGGANFIGDMLAYSEMPHNKGWLGRLFDQWWSLASLVDSDTFPSGGGKNFVLFGDTVQPWNTTVPTFGGGVSTARDGEYLATLYYEDTYRGAVWASPYSTGGSAVSTVLIPPIDPAVYYQMEANDSVTDAAYSWIATTDPDWAGTGYPGPNAPVNIRISSR